MISRGCIVIGTDTPIPDTPTPDTLPIADASTSDDPAMICPFLTLFQGTKEAHYSFRSPYNKTVFQSNIGPDIDRDLSNALLGWSSPGQLDTALVFTWIAVYPDYNVSVQVRFLFSSQIGLVLLLSYFP